MWNDQRSIKLSISVTWTAIAVVAVAIVVLPLLPHVGSFGGSVLFDPVLNQRVLPSLYVVAVPGLVALVCLLRLLGDIDRGEVFTLANVRRLRVISWCGFAIGVVCLITGTVVVASLGFLVIGVGAVFFGLLMRVVKNVIDAARLIKEDNDFTI